MRAGFKKLVSALPIAAIVAAGLMLAIRWTVQDRILVTAIVFYAAQPLVLVGLSGLAAVGAMRQRRRRTMLVAVVLMVACGAWWAAQSFHFRGAAVPGDARRLVLWNIFYGNLGWSGIFETLRELDADIIVLVEAEPKSAEFAAAAEAFLPDYERTEGSGGMVILARGSIAAASHGDLAGGGRYVTARVEVGGRVVRIVGVDIKSDPFRFRRYPLDALGDLVDSFSDEAVIVAGDFNTPPDSVHFGYLRSRLRNAFEVGGEGCGPTWPSILPAWAIDQVWLSEGLNVYQCTVDWTFRSDHRLIVVEIGQ